MKKIIKFIRSLFLWRINPYALLASHLRLKCDTYPIFINEKGEKYALTMYGFVHAERYNAQEQYRILDNDHEILLKKYASKKALLLQKTTAHAHLLVSLETLQQALEKSKQELAQQRHRSTERKNNSFKKLERELEIMRNMLLKEREANTHLRSTQTDILSKKRKSSLKKIINFNVSDADKLSHIKKLIES